MTRIQAVLRPTISVGGEESISVKDLGADAVGHRVTSNGDPVEIGLTALRMPHLIDG